MLAPMAPHIAEELWSKLGHDTSVTFAPFPVADPAMLVTDTVEYPVQINGKVRSRVTVAADATPTAVRGRRAGRRQGAVAALDGQAPKKVIVVPGRMVNIVA